MTLGHRALDVQLAKRSGELLDRRCDHARTVLVVRPPPRQRVDDVVEVNPLRSREVIGELADARLQRVVAPRGDRDEAREGRRARDRPGDAHRRTPRPGRRGLQDDVRVRAADSERVDPDDERLVVFDGLDALDHAQAEILPRNVGAERDHARGRDCPTFEDREALHDAGEARRGLRVAERPLHGADRQGSAAMARERVGEGERLLAVTDLSARPVRLDVGHVVRREARVRHDARDESRLLLVARRPRSERPAPAVAGARRSEYAVDSIVRRERVAKTLEDDGAHPVGAGVTISGGVERLAVAVGRKRTEKAEPDGNERGQERVRAGADSRFALARGEPLAREVDGEEGRRARGVHRETGAAEVEEVRESVGADVVFGVVRMRADAVRVPHLERRRVDARQADVDADRAAAQRAHGQARVVERLHRDLEDHPMLGVHRGGLGVGDLEVARVEAEDVGKESTRMGDRAAGPREAPSVPSPRPPIGRHLADRIATPLEVAPDTLEAHQPARKSAGEPDDRDGFHPKEMLLVIRYICQPVTTRARSCRARWEGVTDGFRDSAATCWQLPEGGGARRRPECGHSSVPAIDLLL